ncbi:hypothetical protein [Oscillibacter sp.]|uniref:hypothetical protein n=1 Tax=Oscillibacter sp. TaxID=1945593 RepID=UPI002897A430|nr:hypothetical protein [Oscillibacter sp.]
MRNSKVGKFTVAGFVILILLVVAILLSNGLRRSSRIVLPDTVLPAGESSGSGGGEDGGIALIAVTPGTVQSAIESLERPAQYRRSIAEERFWTGGSGTTQVLVSVSGDWTRTDCAPKGQQIRHSLTDGTTTYIWYGSQSEVYQCSAGDIAADQEQGIPTYEDVLALPVNQIEKADYRSLSGVNCIYVETGEDENGFVLRYWVSVDTGLLAAAEWLKYGETIYRMGSLVLDAAGPVTQDFTLPDGTVLTAIE